VGETVAYYESLLDTFPDQVIAIIETAWSSRGPRGGLGTQEAYVREVAAVLDEHSARFLFFSWFVLYDLPSGINRDLTRSFGVDPDTEAGRQFVAWQGSLGLLNNDGTAKPAWDAWRQEMAGP
jgi:hypothetical protein